MRSACVVLIVPREVPGGRTRMTSATSGTDRAAGLARLVLDEAEASGRIALVLGEADAPVGVLVEQQRPDGRLAEGRPPGDRHGLAAGDRELERFACAQRPDRRFELVPRR